MKKLLIGIHGKPRAGKDTVKDYLCSKFNLYHYGPSNPVKKATAAMFDIPENYLWNNEMKEKYDDFWGMTYREMAQKVGKESTRDIFGEDFWLRHCQRVWDRIVAEEEPEEGWKNDWQGMVLSCIRYANEVEWVKKNGGTVLFVVRENRPYVANEGHAAEQGLPESMAHWVIDNDKTFEELHFKLDTLINTGMIFRGQKQWTG